MTLLVKRMLVVPTLAVVLSVCAKALVQELDFRR